MEPATTATGLNAKLVITTPRGLETLGTMGVASEFDESNATRASSPIGGGLLSATRKIAFPRTRQGQFAWNFSRLLPKSPHPDRGARWRMGGVNYRGASLSAFHMHAHTTRTYFTYFCAYCLPRGKAREFLSKALPPSPQSE